MTKQEAISIFRDRVDMEVQGSTKVTLNTNGWKPVQTRENLSWIYAGFLYIDLNKAPERLKICSVCNHFFWDSSMNLMRSVCSATANERSGCLCGRACFKVRHKKRMKLRRNQIKARSGKRRGK